MVIPIIFIVFFGAAFFWAALTLYVQGKRLNKLWRNGINGHERLMTLTYASVSFMNAYFMHIILITILVNPDVILDLGIYVMVSLLLGTVGSGAISWLILSKKTVELITAIKDIDTGGHRFEVKKNQLKKTGLLSCRAGFCFSKT
jgi:hypothetical protein